MKHKIGPILKDSVIIISSILLGVVLFFAFKYATAQNIDVVSEHLISEND